MTKIGNFITGRPRFSIQGFLHGPELWGLAVLCLAMGTVAAETGGSLSGNTKEIRFGMSTALTGPAASLGQAMRQGVVVGLEGANARAGSNGCKFELLALDDGYEPARTIPNMHQLIERDQVLGIVGNVGTPTAVAGIPIATNLHTLFFAGFSGSGALRHNPPDHYVINYRASYAEEIDAMIQALVIQGGIRPQEIAFFTQRDSFGDAGFTGGMAALKHYGHPNPALAKHVRYERNSLAVENALVGLLYAEPPPRAVIMVGAYAPCAKFIRLAWESGLRVVFLNVSFVGSEPLATALKDVLAPVLVTQVVPDPHDLSLSVVRRYHEDLHRSDPQAKPSFASLEGYIATQILLLAVDRAKLPLTRESLAMTFEQLGDFDIGLGGTLHLSPADHQASHRIWPTRLEHGAIIPFAWTNMNKLMDEHSSR